MNYLLRKLDTDDTPVWMVWKDPETSEYKPILVAWHNFEQYNAKGFLTLKTFGTKNKAKEWLREFWESYWRI